jgi:hypothetical protein
MWETFKSLGLSARIGGAVGLLGGLAGGAVAIAAAPVVGTIFVVVTFGILFLGFWMAWRPQIQRNRLANGGTAAWGTIVSVRETGWTVQGNYGQAKLTLSVEPPGGGAPYEVETRMLINRFDIPSYQPGTRVQVLIDPRDPRKVAVV